MVAGLPRTEPCSGAGQILPGAHQKNAFQRF